MRLLSSKYLGKKPCFCVSTDTGHYEANGLKHHNSVAMQNLVIHCIEHRDKIALGLIDIKQVEFSNYKGMNGIVGVANSVREATELLRIARAVMYKRNKEMAKLGIKSLTDYQPSQRSGKVYVTGREYDEPDQIQVRTDGQESSMSAIELAEWLAESDDGKLREAEVCLNGTDWVVVNTNCCAPIYTDEMQALIIICDELAELTQHSGMKSAEAKEEDQMKDEIVSILSSIAQLGRSAAILVQIATQKPKAEVVPTILRSNLGWRAFCGKATEAGSSIVALDNTLATTIDNSHPGAGIVQSAGVPVFVRYYFSKFEDLEDYYAKRGLNAKGYADSDTFTAEELENLDGSEELTFDDEQVTFQFEQERAEIDKREDQRWEEI